MIPTIMQEDGLITLQWQRGRDGVAIMFKAGEDVADFTWADRHHFYAEAGIEFKLSQGLPADAQAIFRRVLCLK